MLGRCTGCPLTSVQGEKKNEERVGVVCACKVRDARRCDASDDKNTRVSKLTTTVSLGAGREARLIDRLS